MTKIDFQPMPKRFMVWDKVDKKFVDSKYTTRQWDIHGMDEPSNVWEICSEDRFIFVQSTNLFDKDGKEIFEGSIVENHFINKLGLVYYDEDVAGWRILYQDGTWDDLYYVRADITVTGHILTNPELLEKKNV